MHHRTGLSPCIWGNAGRFSQNAGRGHRSLAKSNQISIAWMPSPYSSEQGGAGRTTFAQQGGGSTRERSNAVSFEASCAQSLRICRLEPLIAFASPASPFSNCQLDPWNGLDGSPRRDHLGAPRSSQVNSANPDHEKQRRADFVVDTSRGFEAARAQVRAILDAIATMPTRRR
jgi:hypothetical protein